MPSPKPLEKPDLYLVARFLDRLWSPDGVAPIGLSKAKLQTAVGLKYELFARYVDFLVGRRFITIEKTKRGDHTVRLSEEGRDAHKQLVRWLRDIFGDRALEPRGRTQADVSPAVGPRPRPSGS